MDDLLREFVTETNESLDVVDVELVRFEQDPNNAKILDNIFRLVHTIKGTCGFLALPRLEALAHAAETLMGKFRDGLPATNDAVTLILATIDRIKEILESLERDQREPDGADDDLISELEISRLDLGEGVVNEPHRDRDRDQFAGPLHPDYLLRGFDGFGEPELGRSGRRKSQRLRWDSKDIQRLRRDDPSGGRHPRLEQ